MGAPGSGLKKAWKQSPVQSRPLYLGSGIGEGNKKAAGGMFVNCGWEAVRGALRGGSEEQLLGLSADASSSGLGEGGWRGANPLSLL